MRTDETPCAHLSKYQRRNLAELSLPFTAGPQPSPPPLPSSMQRSGDSDAGPSAANNEAPAPSNVTGGSAGNSGFQSARSFGGTVASASLNAARGVAGAGANQNRRFSLSFSQGVSYAMVALSNRITSSYVESMMTAKYEKYEEKSYVPAAHLLKLCDKHVGSRRHHSQESQVSAKTMRTRTSSGAPLFEPTKSQESWSSSFLITQRMALMRRSTLRCLGRYSYALDSCHLSCGYKDAFYTKIYTTREKMPCMLCRCMPAGKACSMWIAMTCMPTILSSTRSWLSTPRRSSPLWMGQSNWSTPTLPRPKLSLQKCRYVIHHQICS